MKKIIFLFLLPLFGSAQKYVAVDLGGLKSKTESLSVYLQISAGYRTDLRTVSIYSEIVGQGVLSEYALHGARIGIGIPVSNLILIGMFGTSLVKDEQMGKYQMETISYYRPSYTMKVAKVYDDFSLYLTGKYTTNYSEIGIGIIIQ